MNIVDQFVASIGFSSKKVASWKKQSLWKSFFYVLLLILLSNICLSGFALYKGSQQNLYDQTKMLDPFTLTKEGLHKEGPPQVIALPQIETMIVVGSDTTSSFRTNGFKNILSLGEKQWSYGRVGFPGTSFSYAAFPLLNDENEGKLSNKEVVSWAKEASQKISYFAPLYQYTNTAIDLVTHLAIISLLALAGFGFKKFVKISYREAWTITAYGISAPIFVKTIFELLGFESSYFFLLYWCVAGFFAFRTIRSIGAEAA
ncbi:DUF1189 family protein [Bacillus testis]|uniref:DUF1189 family protein n=1 Tax=Bacillus testis TaxID=1622072 RepID=UPI00067E9B70|nr:DUF1189 family protein [Bacillus testis]